jgi:hypothetical protein
LFIDLLTGNITCNEEGNYRIEEQKWPSPPYQIVYSHEQNSTHSVFMRVCEAWQPLLSLQIYSNNQLQMV